ncbi:MAG: prepilin-type N-terminal cleavage/methylation domain-containing protein [Nitrospirota bacterium]
MENKKTQKGFMLVEVMLAMVIFAIFSIGVFYLSLDTVQRDLKVNLGTEALLYAQEGVEAVRNIRDKNFLLLTNGDKGLSLVAGSWEFIAAPEDIDGYYSRTITIEDIYRNDSGNIDTEGLNYDPDTKKITSEVSWMQKGVIPKSISLTSYLSNWTGDDWIETTCTDFNAGVFDSTVPDVATSPPEDNCNIILEAVEMGSEYFYFANFGHHGNDIIVEGNYAYLATEYSSKGLAVLNISDLGNITIASEVDIGNKGNRLTKSGNYVYMGTQNGALGLAVVDASDPNNAFLYFSWPLGGLGNQPTISGNNLYMTVNESGSGLQIFDVSAGQLPSPLLTDSYDFDNEAYVAKINGNYAYVGLDDDSLGLRVMDISDPYDITEIAFLNVGEEVNAITITGAIAFIGTEDSNDSLQMVNISDPENPTIVTSLDVGGEIEDLVISGDYLYAAVDEQNAGLAAINISNPFSPYLVYNLDIEGKGAGIDADESYVYVATDTQNKGLVIIGTTVANIIESGTFTSQAFDTGSVDTRYNFIEWDHEEVPSASVKFQLRTADSAENIETATWVGSDGTNDTYYENPRTVITLDPGRTGVRYFQYKVFIDSDGITGPTVESVRVNFTP